jgi:hypothetical protein
MTDINKAWHETIVGGCVHDLYVDGDYFRCRKCPGTASATASGPSVRFRTIPDYANDPAVFKQAVAMLIDAGIYLGKIKDQYFWKSDMRGFFTHDADLQLAAMKAVLKMKGIENG